MRLRIRRYTHPRPALVIVDTPKPNCQNCGGNGEVIVGGHEEPDYGPCDCWDLGRFWTLLPLPRLPRWLRRFRAEPADPWAATGMPSAPSGGYSDEPPF